MWKKRRNSKDRNWKAAENRIPFHYPSYLCPPPWTIIDRIWRLCIFKTSSILSKKLLWINTPLQRLKLFRILITTKHILIKHSIIHKEKIISLNPLDILYLHLLHHATNIIRQFFGYSVDDPIFLGVLPKAVDLEDESVIVACSEAHSVATASGGSLANDVGECLLSDGQNSRSVRLGISRSYVFPWGLDAAVEAWVGWNVW